MKLNVVTTDLPSEEDIKIMMTDSVLQSLIDEYMLIKSAVEKSKNDGVPYFIFLEDGMHDIEIDKSFGNLLITKDFADGKESRSSFIRIDSDSITIDHK
jgi:hypothetical protein